MAAGAHTFAISVPIGAYHPFLRDTLESLRAQEGPLQVALLDASGDARVRDLADEYDAFLAYRRHGPDKGQSDAIIEGWRETDGDILGWLNADDNLFPGALAAARDAFRRDPALGLVYGHSTILDEQKRTLGYHWSVEPPGPRLLESGTISQPSCFFRRDGYDSVGGLNQDLHYVMDWDLWIRLYKADVKFGFIDRAMSRVLWGEGTKTASFNRRRREELRKTIKTYALPDKRAKIMRSFAIHNMLDRLPAGLKTSVTRALVRGRNEIHGLSGDGLIVDGAEIPLTHYDDGPKSRLRLEIDGAETVSGVTVDGEEAQITDRTERGLALTLLQPVARAQTATLAIRVAVGGRPYFKHAEWID